MRNLKGLATILLATPALLAQAPAQTPGQRLAAERPEIVRLMDALQFPEAQAKAEALLPATKPVFDKSTPKALTVSTQTFVDTCNTYLMAFQATDNAGQWEKALEYLNTAVALAKENVDSGKEGLTKNRDEWKKNADTFRAFITRNADAIKALHAKTKLEDYEEASMTQVKAWESAVAEGDKWSKVFQYYLDLATNSVTDFQKYATAQEQKIKEQQEGIETYKAFPGNKAKWVEAVVSSKTYFENFSKADKLSYLYRLAVLDPESKKVRNAIDVVLGKAAPEPAPHHKK